MFGYFAGTNYFGELTDINLKEMLFEQRMKEIEADVLPFGIIDDGLPSLPISADDERAGWQIQPRPDLDF